MDCLTRLLPGTLLVAVLVLIVTGFEAAWTLGGGPVPLSSLTVGVLAGLAAAPWARRWPSAAPGVQWGSRRVLRWAIALMGLRLGWDQILAVGPGLLAVVFVGSGLTFGLTLVLGRFWGLPGDRALLLASGTSVCGAAAIAAVDGCRGAPPDDVAFALAAVTLMGTLLLFADPVLFALVPLSQTPYAVWVGASVHEVAQVAGAAAPLDPEGRALASTVKLLRVLLLVPLTLGLSFLPRRPGTPRRIAVPWFALGFFALSLLVSMPAFPQGIVGPLLSLDGGLLTASMVALGLGIDGKRLLSFDRKTLLLAVVPSLFLLVISALLTGIWASSQNGG